jgi:hypothetical protein
MSRTPGINRGSCPVERVTGIEPAWPAWKAGALPLSYTRGLLDRTSRSVETL